MSYVDIVALIALLQLLVFSYLAGSARGTYDVKAPAIRGHEMFERVHRVHMNTLELMVLFLPALYIAARYWPAGYVAAAGAIYVVGRLVYRRSYLKDPESRGTGFLISILPIAALLVAGLAGAVMRLG